MGTWSNELISNPALYLPVGLACLAALVFMFAGLAVRRLRRRIAELEERAGAPLLEVSSLGIRLEERESRIAEAEKRNALLERNLLEAFE